jgi:hypothetical protein
MVMKETVTELRNIVSDFAIRINHIPEEVFSEKPLPNKWSKKEVLGHLIDSASNNLRRFIVCQYENIPPKIVYDQDFWVRANNYQQSAKGDVIAQWQLINTQICAVLDSMPAENYSKQCDTGKSDESLRGLEWLAADYVLHLKHHLNQIISGSFDVIYK